MIGKLKISALLFALTIAAAATVQAHWFSWESRTGLSHDQFGNPYIRHVASIINGFRYRMSLRDFTKGLFWRWSIHNISIQ